MLPLRLNFWCISHNESLESQQKHALRNTFLQALLCSNDKITSGYNREMLVRKKTSIFVEICFTYEQLFHPVHCTACGICQCNSVDKFNLLTASGILTISDQLHCLWGINCFLNCTRHFSTCPYQSGCLHILFSYHCKLSISGKIFLLWNQFLKCLTIIAFQVHLVEVFREKFSEL